VPPKFPWPSARDRLLRGAVDSVIDRAGTIDRGDLCTAGDAGDRLIRRSTSAWKMIARGKRGGISAHDKLSSAQVLP
jgi:hypothetical protein